jgi:hypothetical protein
MSQCTPSTTTKNTFKEWGLFRMCKKKSWKGKKKNNRGDECDQIPLSARMDML